MSETKRILVVLRWPLGGIRTYILYNYPALVAAGYQFTFVVPTDALFASFKSEVMRWKGSEWVEVPVSGHKCRIWPVAFKLLRSKRFSLIHSQGFTAAVHAAIANIFSGVPHIFTSHDVLRPKEQFPGITGNIRRWLLSLLINCADAIVAVSDDARENHLQCLQALRRNENKIITIRNGINTSLFGDARSVEQANLRRQLGLPDGTYLIGFIGRIEEQKGFLPLLHALGEVLQKKPSHPFHIVFLGRDNCPRRYRAELEKRPDVAALMTFMAAASDIRPVLSELDLVVMPSLWEACPLVPMEAMCAGIPVLGSDCIGLREVLFETPSKMVPAGDSHALAEGILSAVAHPWDERARAYATVAKKRFDVSIAANRLLALFDSLRAGGL